MRFKANALLASGVVLMGGVSQMAVAQATQAPAAAQTDAAQTDTAQTNTAQTGASTETPRPAAATGAMDSTDIIVTAQRRSESAQRVPISLVAVNAETLERAHITDIQDLVRVVPNLNVQRAAQAANTKLSIRGIGSIGNSAIEPSVAAFIDGVYIARPGSLLAGLNDVSSVEVLRGPQGTLFGRNASMGAVSYSTTQPQDRLAFEQGFEYGSYNRVRWTGVVNVPLAEGIAIRVSGLYDEAEGFGTNYLTGRKYGDRVTNSVRGAIKFEVTPSLTWIVRGDYQKMGGDGQVPTTVKADTVTPALAATFNTRLRGKVPILNDTYSYNVNQITAGTVDDRQWGVSSDINLDLGGFSLKLLSAYRDWKNEQFQGDLANTPASLISNANAYRSEAHSEELQLTSPETLLDGHLKFVAGLYYFREKYSIGVVSNLGSDYCTLLIAGLSTPAAVRACQLGPQRRAAESSLNQTTESYAAYSQATVNITDQLSFTGGIRYSHDDKDGAVVSAIYNPLAIFQVADNDPNLRFEGGEVTYRANVNYQFTPTALLYASYSTGYKSGGFDPGVALPATANRVFNPETVENYEIGAKTQWWNRRMTLNATLFRTDVTDYQARTFSGTAFTVRNAGDLRQQGIEFETLFRPIPHVTLGVSGDRLWSEYTSFPTAPGLPGFGGTQDLTGARVPNSPKWMVATSAMVDGDVPMGGSDYHWSLSSQVNYQSDSDVGGGGDNNPQGIQEGYALLSARFAVGPGSRQWEFYVSGDNLTDKRYCTIIATQALATQLGLVDRVTGGAIQRCVLGDPRTARLGFKIRL